MQYNETTALKALGLKKKTELAEQCRCHIQSFYNKKGQDLPARLNYVVELLVKIKKLESQIKDTERVLENKQAIIEELKK